ncbi:MAG: N-acetylmuramoyl-L-alanine amidase [Alphaproteobacteria bacterium]|nr:MAG: N-acetylmuramoyl-L-alanine amidase [Alphaproteobacteria bacterium]
MRAHHFLKALLCLVFIMTSTAAHALEVKQIRFGAHPGKVRMVLDISDVTDYRAFVLSSPYRMVIDLPTFHWAAGRVQKPKLAMISDIRQGKLVPGISRIVFDLEQPITIQSAFLLPKQGNKENRIVIDYKITTPQKFNATKSIIHGTLKVEDYKNKTAAAENTAVPRPPANTARPLYPSREKPLIIIDPGHGGQDPGALGHSRIYEKNVVLALAKQLRKRLLASGKYRVLLTRERDVFVRLKNRVKFARKHGGDLFISLHADSIHKPSVHGTSVYTLSKKASDAQTAKLAEKENQADLIGGVGLSVEDEQVAFILGDFLMNDTMNQSKFFANKLVSKLKAHKIYTLQNPHRYAGFAVLKAPDIPSILIEAGFMSNKKEATLLNQNAHRQKMAAAIHAGIDSYFNYVYQNEQH